MLTNTNSGLPEMQAHTAFSCLLAMHCYVLANDKNKRLIENKNESKHWVYLEHYFTNSTHIDWLTLC